MGFVGRDDIPIKDVAEQWLGGMTITAIAAQHKVTHPAISRRITKARTLYPDLPWHLRDKPGESAAGYMHMKDGKAGAYSGRGQAIRQGRHTPGR